MVCHESRIAAIYATDVGCSLLLVALCLAVWRVTPQQLDLRLKRHLPVRTPCARRVANGENRPTQLYDSRTLFSTVCALHRWFTANLWRILLGTADCRFQLGS